MGGRAGGGARGGARPSISDVRALGKQISAQQAVVSRFNKEYKAASGAYIAAQNPTAKANAEARINAVNEKLNQAYFKLQDLKTKMEGYTKALNGGRKKKGGDVDLPF